MAAAAGKSGRIAAATKKNEQTRLAVEQQLMEFTAHAKTFMVGNENSKLYTA